jgi:hypothetical protein
LPLNTTVDRLALNQENLPASPEPVKAVPGGSNYLALPNPQDWAMGVCLTHKGLEENGGWLLLHRERPVKVPIG